MGLLTMHTLDCLKDKEGIRLLENYHRAKQGEPKVGKLCKKVFEDDEFEEIPVPKRKKVTFKSGPFELSTYVEE